MNTDRFGFRVWDTKRSCYVDNATCYLCECGSIEVYRTALGERYFDDDSYNGRYIPEQCMGLRDKDGTLIYEGDIICYDDTPYNAYATKKTGTVVWYKSAFCLYYKNELGDFYDPIICVNDDFWSRKTEIIGNIHEVKE